jgi:hypothetical protein
MVVDGMQVLDEEDWLDRLNVPFRHHGTGMTDQEVTELSDCVDVGVLRDYHLAVGKRSGAVVASIDADTLDQVPDAFYLSRVLFDEGVLHTNAEWVAQNYSGKPKAWFLLHLGLTHNYEHLGEIRTILSLLGGLEDQNSSRSDARAQSVSLATSN